MKPFILAMLTWLAIDSANAEGIAVHVFGMGVWSCARWLTNPADASEGGTWVLGAWTGMNFKNDGRS